MSSVAAECPTSPAERKRHWLWPTRLRVIAGLAIALAIWGWLDVRQRGQFDPDHWWRHKTDFTVYTEAGAAFFDGRDPYTVTNLRRWTYLYLPLFAIVVSPLHDLDPPDQVIVWFTVSVLLGWGCYRELMKIARQVLPPGTPQGHFGAIPTWLGVVAVTAAMLPALNCLQRGQVGVAKLYLLLLGFRLLIDTRSPLRPLLGGLAFALAITLKVTPIVPAAVAVGQICLVAWRNGGADAWKRAAAGSLGTAGGLVCFVLLVPAALVGWQANLHHLDTWWNRVAMRADELIADDFAGNSTSVRNQSLANAAYRLGNWTHYYFAGGPYDEGSEQLRKGGGGLVMSLPWARRTVLAVRVLGGCLLLAVGYRLGREGDKLSLAATFGLACAATLVIFPIARGHYYVLFLPAVTFVSLWLLRAERPRWAIAAATLPAVLVIAHYSAVYIAGRVGLLGLGTTAWYFTLSVALLRMQPRPAAQASGLRDAEPPPASRPLAA